MPSDFSANTTNINTAVNLNLQAFLRYTTLGFSLRSCPTSGERLCRGYKKFDFTVDEGKGRLNPSRDKK